MTHRTVLALALGAILAGPLAAGSLVFLGYPDGYHVYADTGAGIARAVIGRRIANLAVGGEIALVRSGNEAHVVGATASGIAIERLPLGTINSATVTERMVLMHSGGQTWVASLRSDGIELKMVAPRHPSSIHATGRLIYLSLGGEGVLLGATPSGLATQPVGRPQSVNLGREVAVLREGGRVLVVTLGDGGFHTAQENRPPSVVVLEADDADRDSRRASAFERMTQGR